MTEPTTEAGKRLIGWWVSQSGPPEPRVDVLQSLVAAIEDEAASFDLDYFRRGYERAVAAERARIAEALPRAIHLATHNHSGLPDSADITCGPALEDRVLAAAVLALLEPTDE